ncbi:MAG: alpha-L-rhamnosidase C-terminal domain-containing protein [Planctomycetota bacterium]
MMVQHMVSPIQAFVVACVTLCSVAAWASDTPDWQAQWIAPPKVTTETNSWWCFRKQVELPAETGSCVARIACDSKYWLWINGEIVIREGQLKRGPTPDDTYYDEVDLSSAFRPGENTIAVLVWHFGREGMSHKSSGQVGLLFDASCGGQRIDSDATWRVRRHPAYVSTAEPHPNWRLPESNVAFDARKDIGDWTSASFDDSEWTTAIGMGTPPVAPWNQLVLRSIPQWRHSELRDYENADSFPEVSTGEPIIARLPYNAQVTPYLEVEGEAGQLINLRTDNHMGGSEPGVRAEYTTQAGRQAYESLGWINGHEMIYKIPAGVKIYALKYRESGYDTDFAGSFACDNEQINRLWQKAQRTLYLEMRDGYVDCPGRERAQWWGDITSELQQGFYALDRRSDQLAAKAIRELAAWQKPTGVLFSPVPAGNWDQELPMQMLASVGRYGFWEYYRHTGDIGTIRSVYPAVNRYLALWQVDDEGIVVPRKGGWTWGDWGKNKDMPLLFNAWYYLALDGRSRMAELFGDTDRAEQDRETMRRLADAFNAKFWTDEGYRSPGHAGPIDERGSALAVVAGIADESKHATLRELFAQHRNASPYMEKYVLEALIRMDDREGAVERLLLRYSKMIDSPITTLWEGWGIGTEGFGGGSYNHAWSGGPLTLLSQYFAGVDPITPGYDRYRIAPLLGPLQHTNAVVPSPKGPIHVGVVRDGDTVNYELQLPEEGDAEVVLPCDATDELTINSERQDNAIGDPSRTDDTVTLLLPPGTYSIAITPKPTN